MSFLSFGWRIRWEYSIVRQSRSQAQLAKCHLVRVAWHRIKNSVGQVGYLTAMSTSYYA